MRLLPGFIPVTQPDVPFYICLSAAEKLTMSQPVSAWTKWVTFTQLLQRISDEEEDGDLIIQRLSAVYSELTDHGRRPLTVDVFSDWLSRLTPEGPEITDQIFYVLDREGMGAMKLVEFILGILCVFMKLSVISRGGVTSSLIRARRQLIFMYLDINARGLISDSDFLRILEMEAELSRKSVKTPSVSHGLQSCIDGAAVCISAAADSEFIVQEPPHQATLVRNAWEYVRSQGSVLNYDAFCDAFDLKVIPEPLHILRWNLNLKRVLGITHKPQTLSTQSLQDIRDALVTIVDDGIKVASVWLKNTAERVHTKVTTGAVGNENCSENIQHDNQITATSPANAICTETTFLEAQLTTSPPESKSETQGEENNEAHPDSQQAEAVETAPSSCAQEVEADGGTESSVTYDKSKWPFEDTSGGEAPAMCLAVTTATEDSSYPFPRDLFPSDCQRVDSTLSASIDLESDPTDTGLGVACALDQSIPTEVSADESVPEEGEVQSFSIPPIPGNRRSRSEYLKKYLFPLLRYSTASEICRVLPGKRELLEDFVHILNAVVETFAAEDFIMTMSSQVNRCVIIGATEGSLMKTTSLLQTAFRTFQSSTLALNSTLIPMDTCVIHAGNYLCDHQKVSEKSEIMYTLMALLSLKLAYPRQFFLLRGYNEGPENNTFQAACIDLFGSIEGIAIWNRVLDLAEYASFGVEVGSKGYVFGGTLTSDVEKYLPHFNKIAKPLHFTTTGGKTKVWHAPEGSRHRAMHDYNLREIEGAMISSLCMQESDTSVSAAVKLRTTRNTRWIVQQQQIGTTIHLRWNPYSVLQVNKAKDDADDWELEVFNDGVWTPIAINDPLCAAVRGEVKASSLSDTIAQCEVHLKAGHVLTKMSSV